MIKYYLLLFLSFSIIYTQEVNDKWLDTILEKNVSVKNSQTLDKEEKQKNNTYFTIQVAAKASFADAQEVVKILNNSNFNYFFLKMKMKFYSHKGLSLVKSLILFFSLVMLTGVSSYCIRKVKIKINQVMDERVNDSYSSF